MNEIDMLCSDDEYIGLYTKLSKKELEYNTYIAEAKEEGFNNGFNDVLIMVRKLAFKKEILILPKI